MSCCQNIKAHVGYTQNQEWFVVMTPDDHIVCECHSQYTGFHMTTPFSLQQWLHQWEQCQEHFFHHQDVYVEWEQYVPDVLLSKTSKAIRGKVYQRT